VIKKPAAEQNTLTRVFVSHSSQDKVLAEKVCASLENSGLRCWIAPRDIEPGASWASSIIKAIVECEIMVLVFSSHSNSSKQVLREVERAVQHDLKIITYRVDDSIPGQDLEYFLSTVQWLDAHSGDTDSHLELMVQSVKNIRDSNAVAVSGQDPASKFSMPQAMDSIAQGRSSKSRQSILKHALLVGLVLIASWAAINYLTEQIGEPEKVVYDSGSDQKMVVLPFKNLSGTRELDWLRTGLSEMIITDLSQSTSFRVLSNQELHEDAPSNRLLATDFGSTEDLLELAEVTGSSTILTGSFALVGETLQISIKVQDGHSGGTLLAKRDSGPQDKVFEIIDGLSNLVRRDFISSGEELLEKDLREVTSNSLQAYRYYVEALQFDLQAKREEAIPLLLQAVEIDPGFAMAHARLGWIYQNLGQAGKSAQSIATAFDNKDRLPARERYLIEGLHYTLRWDTQHLAVRAFQDALALDPGLNSARHQLATLYAKLEMFSAAIELWEILREGDYEYTGVENGLANMYTALGDFDKSEKVLQSLFRRNRDSMMVRVVLGWHYTQVGNTQESLAQYEEALVIQPAGSPFLSNGIWRAMVVDRNYDSAATVVDELLAVKNPYANWLGYIDTAYLKLIRGDATAALDVLEQAAVAYPSANAFTAAARLKAAGVYYANGQYVAAVEEADRAVTESQGEWPEWEARFIIASSEHSLGQLDDAATSALEIARQATLDPGEILTRMHHHLQGRFAMNAGNNEKAITELLLATQTLSPYGVKYHFHRQPDHALVWYDLGLAYMQDNQPEKALPWFYKIIESHMERVFYPIQYVRSYYQLGLAHEQLGQWQEARQNYAKFAGYWADGELDMEAVRQAANQASP
jgi:tetratricopeptide (TPR) repeat protein